MDKFNALYAQVKMAQLAAQRDEARKEAEREAETIRMLNMVNRSSEKRYAKRIAESRRKAAKLAALLTKVISTLCVFAGLSFGFGFVLLLAKLYHGAFVSLLAGCGFLLASVLLDFAIQKKRG